MKTSSAAVKKKTVQKRARRKALPKKRLLSAGAKPARLLSPGEPAPVRVENATGRADCLIICDHASNRVPARLGNLGLSRADLKKHIAWDPGTENIGRYLSRALDAPAIYSTYSRLVVDVNRGPASPECMREVSDHIAVPANRGLTRAQKKARLDTFFHPYHRALAAEVSRFTRKKRVPLLVSLHSFTPEMDGFKRPWHIGLLWNREEGIARALAANLRRLNPGIVVGENEPYSLRAENLSKNTISTHAESRGLPYVLIEFRQDLVDTPAKARHWAKIFLESLAPVLADPDTYRRRSAKKPVPATRKRPLAKKAAVPACRSARK